MNDRNFDLLERVENTREKAHVNFLKFDLDEIREHFQETVKIIREEIFFSQEIYEMGKIQIAENMWRAQIVYLSGALDYFMHEMTKYGVNNIFQGKWEKTEPYHKLEINMELLETILKEPEKDWIIEFTNNKFSRATMVSYRNVKKHLTLIGINIQDVANNAFCEQESEEKSLDKIQRRLKELYARRNRIAHQNDRNHEDAELKEISQETVQGFCSDITKIVDAIYTCAREK